jgi:signal peptidase II
MTLKIKILFFCLLVLLFIGCDRVTKDIAKDELRGKPPMSYFDDKLRLEFAENTGAFLSLGADWSNTKSFWILTVLPLGFLLGFFVFIMTRAKRLSSFEMTAFILIFSGGAGNMIDRLLFNRHVTDFINLGINNIRTGIFNIADVYVTTGALMLLFSYVKKSFYKTHPGPSP